MLTLFLQHKGLPKGSVVCPVIEVLDNLEEAQRELQNVLNHRRAHDPTLAFGEGASSQNPQPRDKKTQDKKLKETSTGPAKVVLDDEGTDDEADFL